MNDSNNRDDEQKQAPGEGDAVDESEGLDEPSAQDLLVEDEEWAPEEGEAEATGGVEVDPDASAETADGAELDRTAEISSDEINQGMDAEELREAAKKAEREAREGGEESADEATAETSDSPLPSPGDGGGLGGAETGPMDETPTPGEEGPAEAKVGVEGSDPTADTQPPEGDDEQEGDALAETRPPEATGEVEVETESNLDEAPMDLDEVSDVEVEEVESGPPSLPEKPDDVKGSRETPDQKLEFSSGDRVGDRFTVERYLGSSGGGISYLCRQDETGTPVVIKVLAMPPPGGEHLEWIRETIRTASQVRTQNLTDILGMGTTEDGNVYVAMEYVKGESLSSAVSKQREAGDEISVAEMFHVVAQICDGLTVIHERMPHGLLTPFNIYLSDAGQLKIQNLGFGQISARYLHGQGEGPFRESIYVAPEVGANPERLTEAADIYSTAMIAAELLSGGGLPREKGQARGVAVRIAEQYGEGLYKLIGSSLAENPAKRISTPDEFRMGLENAVEDVGVDPADGLPEGGLPVGPAVDVRSGGDDDLFDIPGPEESQEIQTDEAEERYLVRKEGLDYGPFTKEEVLEQLYDDEIDEHTSVLDRKTQDRAPLGEQDDFVEEVEEYIPIREERRRKERERREEIERKVKQGGKAVLVVGIVAGLAVLSVVSYYYFTRPDPQRLPMNKAFVSLDYKFLPPPEDFQTVSANEKVLEKIFNPEAAKEDIAEHVGQTGGGSAGSGSAGGGATAGGGDGGGGGGAGGGGKGESDDNVSTVNMAQSGKNVDRLKDREINNIILSDFSALRGCIQKELDDNPSFSGVTIQFYIRPNGTTGGVTLQEKQYLNEPVGRCLVREFRNMEFPAHSAVSNRGVTFPLEIQR